jgi:exodeoxyribonuclease VII small subunit
MAKSTQPTYEQLKAELDEVMSALAQDDLDVDKALAYYQQGLELVQALEKYLKTAENKVVELQAKFKIDSK